MYAWTMLTKFNCQSTTRVKNAVIFTHYFISLMFYPFSFAEVALPELLEEPHHAASSKLS